MRNDPAKQNVIVLFPGGNSQHNVGKLLLCVGQFNTVDGQKYQHGVSTNAFIAIRIYTMDFREYNNGVWRVVEKSEAERLAILEDYRASAAVLQKDMGSDPTYVEELPEMTRFLQELLVPGSTLKN